MTSFDYGITSPIMVVTGFMASKDVVCPNCNVMHSFLQFFNQLNKNELDRNPGIKRQHSNDGTSVNILEKTSYYGISIMGK